MPVHTYVIEQRGGEWCLLTEDKSRVLGCHASKEGAEAQEAAIRSYADLHTLHAVEIFKAGKWNGDVYTETDLDAMVDAYKQVGFTPPIKFGHADRDGEPALGWVENLRRVGSTLVADLAALPKSVFEAIRQRSYDAVSAEVFLNLDRGGRKYPKVLKALALLGSQVPAVDLKPLHDAMPRTPAAAFAAYSVDLTATDDAPAEPAEPTKEPAMADDPKEPQDPQPAPEPKSEVKALEQRDDEVVISATTLNELKERIALLEQFKARNFEAQLEQATATLEQERAQARDEKIAHKVAKLKIPALRPFATAFYDLALSQNGHAKTYAVDKSGEAVKPEDVVDRWVSWVNRQSDALFKTLSVKAAPVDMNEPEEISARVDYRARKHMEKHGEKDYVTAFKAVLDADPDLKAEYAQS